MKKKVGQTLSLLILMTVGSIQAMAAAAGESGDTTSDERSSLATAIVGKKPDEVVILLDRNPSMVNVKNAAGHTPLMHAIEFADNPRMVKLLLDRGADPHSEYLRIKHTPLMEVVEFADNPDPGIKPPEDGTVLTGAVRRGYVGAVEVLLGATDVNLPIHGGDERSLLMVAIKKDHYSVIKLLLENGAEMKRDKKGHTPFEIALKINWSPCFIEARLLLNEERTWSRRRLGVIAWLLGRI